MDRLYKHEYNIKTIFDEVANDMDKEFWVPAKKLWIIRHVWVMFGTTANVGDRYPRIRIYNVARNLLFSLPCKTAIVASRWDIIQFAPDLQDDIAIRTGNSATQSMPLLVMPEGWSIRVDDAGGVDNNDDMTLVITHEELPL